MRGKNILMEFMIGLIMFCVGLFWLFKRVDVTIGSGGFMIGSFHVNGGLILVPFIVGVIWLFINVDSFMAKALSIVGLLLIVADIIMNIRFHMYGVSLYELVIMLIFIAGGLGLLIKTLFGGNGQSKKKDKDKDKEGNF